jgi:hypothetical protein
MKLAKNKLSAPTQTLEIAYRQRGSRYFGSQALRTLRQLLHRGVGRLRRPHVNCHLCIVVAPAVLEYSLRTIAFYYNPIRKHWISPPNRSKPLTGHPLVNRLVWSKRSIRKRDIVNLSVRTAKHSGQEALLRPFAADTSGVRDTEGGGRIQ